MGTKISSDLTRNDVIVNWKDKAGKTFTGTLVERKAIKSAYKNTDGTDKQMHIFSFKVVDGDMPFIKKDVNKEYVEANVTDGQVVSLFPPSRLLNGLNQITVGQTVKVTYLGLGKKSAKGGNKPHTYDLEVL